MVEMHGSWLAVPYGDKLVEKLNKHFSISGIPMLIIMKKQPGTEDWVSATTNGRGIVQGNKDNPDKALQDMLDLRILSKK